MIEVVVVGIEVGCEVLIKMVVDLIGVIVDYYVEIGLFGFVLIVDVFGGVDVCFKEFVYELFLGVDFLVGW